MERIPMIGGSKNDHSAPAVASGPVDREVSSW
jgi:hypothetical protein